MAEFTFGSVCSGIEAASVAWTPLGWRPAFFAEVDPFPCAVLAHHYPETPNLGDFTTIEGEPGSIDVLVGGTPCQGFSLAGQRRGLDDDRSNLALGFLRLAYRARPEWVVWENVPGVLSSGEGRDFACFLGGLAGLDILPPAGGWKSGGIIPGASAGHYGCAYRVLDARYFGCAASRRRVFVVGYLGDWRRAAAVLLERTCLSIDRGRPETEPRRAAAGTRRGAADTPRAIALTDRKREGGRKLEWRVELAYTPLVRKGGGSRTERQIVTPCGELRVLTPRETERAMGLPDDYTAVPWRDGIMPEVHRNEMLGNTIAVPPLAWIGHRIMEVSPDAR